MLVPILHSTARKHYNVFMDRGKEFLGKEFLGKEYCLILFNRH